MNNYIELTLLPNIEEDIPIYFLWEKVYQQLHLAFVEVKDANNKIPVGISFPNYDEQQHQLGCKLRLFASSEDSLKALNLEKWLSRLTDYVHITSAKTVPKSVKKYAYFKRPRVENNNEKMARRRAERHGINLEDARLHFKGRQEKTCTAPFIFMSSLNSKQRFPLLIQKIETDNSDTSKGFSTYGLSSQSSVPIF